MTFLISHLLILFNLITTLTSGYSCLYYFVKTLTSVSLQVAYYAQLFQLSEATAGKVLSGSRLVSIGTLAALTLCLVLSTPPTQALSRCSLLSDKRPSCPISTREEQGYNRNFPNFGRGQHQSHSNYSLPYVLDKAVSIYRLGLAVSLAITAALLVATGSVAVWQLSQRKVGRVLSNRRNKGLTSISENLASPRAEIETIPIGIAWRESEEEMVSLY